MRSTERTENGARTILNTAERPFHLRALFISRTRMGNSAPFMPPNMLSSATRGLFPMFCTLLLNLASLRHMILSVLWMLRILVGICMVF
ncbi:hypothetical protein OIU84_016772 [Salix udensis]|uniref:Uncharacterized protein n=1 Tax=Salix udensis TaxID=889485 RepID=A0AAD6NQA2_9ROSI|nr:hypothetical protein OIU84_016772 [Salix udensis]